MFCEKELIATFALSIGIVLLFIPMFIIFGNYYQNLQK